MTANDSVFFCIDGPEYGETGCALGHTDVLLCSHIQVHFHPRQPLGLPDWVLSCIKLQLATRFNMGLDGFPTRHAGRFNHICKLKEQRIRMGRT